MNEKTPSNLPKEGKVEEPERLVPERPIFPKKATEKIPTIPKLNRFGEPSDIVAKVEDKEEGATPFMPEKGLTPEDVQRRETIKKVVIFSIIVLLVALAVVIVIQRGILQPKKAAAPAPEVVPAKEEEIEVVTDLDGDQMLDTWEKENGLNPSDANDAKLDLDFDKLINLEEYNYQTDPKNPDTDGDKYKDGDEVRNGYDPRGPGKLEEKVTEEKSLLAFKGTWQGTMAGGVYQIKDLNLTMEADGTMSGKFTSTLERYRMQNEMKGNFDFKKETNSFSAKLEGASNLLVRAAGPTSGNLVLSLEGREANGEITGTWTITPLTSGILWLKSDRGNLKIKKT